MTKNEISEHAGSRGRRRRRAVGAPAVFAFLRGNGPGGNLIRVNTGGVWLIRPGASTNLALLSRRARRGGHVGPTRKGRVYRYRNSHAPGLNTKVRRQSAVFYFPPTCFSLSACSSALIGQRDGQRRLKSVIYSRPYGLTSEPRRVRTCKCQRDEFCPGTGCRGSRGSR